MSFTVCRLRFEIDAANVRAAHEPWDVQWILHFLDVVIENMGESNYLDIAFGCYKIVFRIRDTSVT